MLDASVEGHATLGADSTYDSKDFDQPKTKNALADAHEHVYAYELGA